MLPSLPVKNSVLRQLGITDDVPHGLARLKHNLLIPPSHTPSQERNICANSALRGLATERRRYQWQPPNRNGAQIFRERLKNTIAKSPSRSDPIDTFRSLHYLDQIALACLAAGCRDCRAPDCLQYRRKLESVVPVCRSWPGLRDWVLCITSCSLRTARDINLSQNHTQDRSQDLGDEMSKDGLSPEWDSWDIELLQRFRNHLTACIVLTHKAQIKGNWDITGTLVKIDNRVVADENELSGLIGRPLSEPSIVSSRRCPVLPLKF